MDKRAWLATKQEKHASAEAPSVHDVLQLGVKYLEGLRCQTSFAGFLREGFAASKDLDEVEVAHQGGMAVDVQHKGRS